MSRGISRHPTMENYTRFPMAAFPWSGWGVKNGRGLIHITEAGKAVAARLRSSPDIRLSDFNKFPEDAKPAFIRWSFYSMLSRAGFNIDSVNSVIEKDEAILKKYGLPYDGDVFFSPFQQLSRITLKKYCPEFIPDLNKAAGANLNSVADALPQGGTIVRSRSALVFELSEHIAQVVDSASELITEIKLAIGKGNNLNDATDALFLAYSAKNRDIFYPLIANLFCVIGFDCRLSRGGQNYERADAIILDTKRCIPIEIKSPGEETEISVKGVRQALENKVILLSRKNYPTDAETTSLVVGYNPPNPRSEVHELVDDIHTAFNIRVGIIDFRSLLSLAVHSVASGKKIDFCDFHLLKGVVRVERLTTENQ